MMTIRFHAGQRILCRGHEWQVLGAEKTKIANGGEVWVIDALGLNGIVQGESFSFLSDLDHIEALDPAVITPDLDTSAKGRRAKLYWEACLRRLLPRNGRLYIGQHGAFDPLAYQMEPAAQALGLMRPRILIGDAVGLGKTIECGILLSELIRRGKGRRILCAVPKAILQQFQDEMWGRFAIPFHRLDSKGLERLRQDLPSSMNPFHHFNKAIISIDTLKLKKYQKLLEDCQWDALIIDECHNIADRTDGLGGSARHKVAKRLAQNSNAVILMSATPHDGTKTGFASLIKILDRTKIGNDETYTSDDFREHFIRRTRSKIADQLTHREPRKQLMQAIELTDAETDLLVSIHDGEKRTALLTEKSSRFGRELFKTTLIKSFLSSPQALRSTAANKLKNLEASKAAPDQDHESFKQFLRDIIVDCEALKSFSRLDFLADYIKKNPTSATDRLVIFTERIATLDLLVEFLKDKGIVADEYQSKEKIQTKGALVARASGGTGDVELQAIVKEFQSAKSGVQILVATNVASEGLNLHQNCHRLIHFDLPWSLIVLEQRNGRIDRLGQTKAPQIHYFASVVAKKAKADIQRTLKDDLWIVDKIKKRSNTAAADMDEESLSKFTDGEEEELSNTKNYEEGRIQEEFNPGNDLLAIFDLAGTANDREHTARPKPGQLPTLFEKSPVDFIKGVCAESAGEAEGARMKITEETSGRITIELNRALKHETNQWPSEYQGLDDRIILESNTRDMSDYYLARLNNSELIDRSFMNEIHPLIALLENAALGFFPGNTVPTVSLARGEHPETVYFLVQSSLFNDHNQVVTQYWQLLEHRKGSPHFRKLVEDVSDNDHALGIVKWLNTNLARMKQKKSLTPKEEKRIESLTRKAIEEMTAVTSEAREKRQRQLFPEIKAQSQKIRQWTTARTAYLNEQMILHKETVHGGAHSQIKKAQTEARDLERDSKSYNEFVKKYMSTNAEPDVRILGILIEEESN
jgi:superfamily II DNA or RNA helicase